MINSKYLLIINPNSGIGNHTKNLYKIIKYFTKKEIKTDIQYTEYPGHATIIARESIKKNYTAVIGCGGDGTINEVVNGLSGSNIKMGIIPWGTGNVFVHEMRFPKNLKKICKIIIKERFIKIDVGCCNKKYFLLMTSIGFDAYSLKHTNKSFIKKILGIFAYIIGALKAFINYKFPELEVKLDNGVIEKGTFILVSNTSRYGRYFKITPFANPFDGLLDVIIYKGRGRLNFIKLAVNIIWNTITGNHKNNHYFFSKKNNYHKVKSLEILSSDKDIFFQIDGDYFTGNKISIDVKENYLNIILPKKTIKKYLRRRYNINKI